MTLDLYSHRLFAFVLFTPAASVSSCTERSSPGSSCTCSWAYFLTLCFSELLALSPGSKKEWWPCWYRTWPLELFIIASLQLGHHPWDHLQSPSAHGEWHWWGWQWRLVLLKDFKENLGLGCVAKWIKRRSGALRSQVQSLIRAWTRSNQWVHN